MIEWSEKMNCKFSKDKILKVAKKEFLKKGYKGVSMRHIAKLCKFTTGAIYGLSLIHI